MFLLPAETMPGQLAFAVPTMANFDYLAAIFRTGTLNYVLTWDSTQPHNVKWAPGGGGGGVTSITATDPMVVTPSPITTTGVISINVFKASGASHDIGAVPDPGSTAGTTHYLREDATWAVPPGSGTVTSITATSPIVVTPSPLTATGVISHATSGVTAATYGDSTHIPQFTVEADGHITAASNIPIGVGGGVLQGQEFTATGAFTFNVPTNVTSVWITMVGAGGAGGGATTAGTGAGGGASGEIVFMQPQIAVSGGTITGSVGAGGTGVSGANGNAGGNTTCGLFTALGGLGGIGGSSATTGGQGGGPNGGAGGAKGTPGVAGSMGLAESPTYFGGGGGGGGGSATSANGGLGAPAGGQVGGSGGVAGGSQAGGGGGASTPYGVGASGGAGGANGSNATIRGTGGGGGGGLATSSTGGTGGNGYVLIQWIS